MTQTTATFLDQNSTGSNSNIAPPAYNINSVPTTYSPIKINSDIFDSNRPSYDKPSISRVNEYASYNPYVPRTPHTPRHFWLIYIIDDQQFINSEDNHPRKYISSDETLTDFFVLCRAVWCFSALWCFSFWHLQQGRLTVFDPPQNN